MPVWVPLSASGGATRDQTQWTARSEILFSHVSVKSVEKRTRGSTSRLLGGSGQGTGVSITNM